MQWALTLLLLTLGWVSNALLIKFSSSILANFLLSHFIGFGNILRGLIRTLAKKSFL